MKSSLDRLVHVPAFSEFFARAKRTANYFMAQRGDSHAVNLCIADAYEAGRRDENEACADEATLPKETP